MVQQMTPKVFQLAALRAKRKRRRAGKLRTVHQVGAGHPILSGVMQTETTKAHEYREREIDSPKMLTGREELMATKSTKNLK
jgi:hypothetical protein